MTDLKDLLNRAYGGSLAGSSGTVALGGISCDSRKVQKNDLFIAIRGVKADGTDFIRDAVTRGAAAVAGTGPAPQGLAVPYIEVPDGRDAAARLSAAFYQYPARSLKLIGITGTNGKTTTSYLVEHLLKRTGQAPGVIGTVNYRYAGTVIPAVETTPGPLDLQRLLADMRDAGTRVVAMEVSAHALDQGRVAGLEYEAAVFTNLTQDHLDYFVNFDEYFAAKKKLFLQLAPSGTAVLNADDPWCRKLRSEISRPVLTFGLAPTADVLAADIVYTGKGTSFTMRCGDKTFAVKSPLVGTHNVYNALGAVAALTACGSRPQELAAALSDFAGVPGRLEPIEGGQDFSVFIDYAHTPDGLEKVLASLRTATAGKLLVVFGCGGDRDKTKRPQMAAVAAKYCDHVYLTTDNPRSEDPRVIIDEICAGFPADHRHYTAVIDRKKAIRQALLAARSGDTVLLAGKGHETSQIIGDRVLPFSDAEEARRVLSGR